MPKQFSIGLMLAVVTALCIVLSVWIAPRERQRRALQAIVAAGGTVDYVDDGDLLGIRLVGTRFTDDMLGHLEALPTIESLDLEDSEITDAGLVHLAELPDLQNLWLDGTRITDAGLVHLQRLTKLQHLGLEITQVTDDGIARLQKALPNCKIWQK
jgi:Leucine-rich repeat (LRR) protein